MTTLLQKFSLYEDIGIAEKDFLEIISKCENIYASQNFYLKSCFFIWSEKDEVYGIGDNSSGQLGLGDNKEVKNKIKILDLINEKIIKFVEGRGCVFLISENHVYSWGWNFWGQLAIGKCGEESEYKKPVKNEFLIEIMDISCGYLHYMALSKSGQVYTWGLNTEGQIGNGQMEMPDKEVISIPYKVSFPNNELIKSIHCYANCSFAITNNGSVYFWGQNEWGNFRNNRRRIFSNPFELNFRILKEVQPIKKIYCTLEYIYVLCGSNVFRSYENEEMSLIENMNNIVDIISDEKERLICQKYTDGKDMCVYSCLGQEVKEIGYKNLMQYFANKYHSTFKTIRRVSQTEEFVQDTEIDSIGNKISFIFTKDNLSLWDIEEDDSEFSYEDESHETDIEHKSFDRPNLKRKRSFKKNVESSLQTSKEWKLNPISLSNLPMVK